jgi:hypothetical protein
MSHIDAFTEMAFPSATVQAYDPDYILWEKITALHSFCTQTKALSTQRLSRHWYDVDCLLQTKFADPLTSHQAMIDVINMKSKRWPENGVVYEDILDGNLKLLPNTVRTKGIHDDYSATINANMFFNRPDDFNTILERLQIEQDKINNSLALQNA